jgi:hypothetical protein
MSRWKQQPGGLVIALIGAVFTAWNLSPINNQTDEAQLLPLHSVLRRDNDVFASNAAGVYRAELSRKTWKQLPLPDSMPVNGYFADQPTNSKLILYYTPKEIKTETANAKTGVYGLYVSRDDGQTWRLISRKDDYSRVFLHPNGNLFAVTNAENFMGPAHILVSHNLGESWRDITGKSFGWILGIFADPDHPDLICLFGNDIRGYIFQATDENYEWRATRDWEWGSKHQTEEGFLSRGYSTTTTAYILQATLLNYFAHDFGKRVTLPGFDIAPQRSAYEFGKAQAKVIQVSIPFLTEPHVMKALEKEWQDSGRKRSTKIILVDQKDGLGLWGLKVVSPDGKQTYIQPSISKSVYESKDRETIKQQLRGTGGFQAHEIAYGKPYKRLIDLSQLYDFSGPGVYKVQIVYDSVWLADPDQDEWPGSFTGQVFTVTITGS